MMVSVPKESQMEGENSEWSKGGRARLNLGTPRHSSDFIVSWECLLECRTSLDVV